MAQVNGTGRINYSRQSISQQSSLQIRNLKRQEKHIFSQNNQSQQDGEISQMNKLANASSNQSDRRASINDGRRRIIGDTQVPEQPPICDDKIFRRKIKNPERRKSGLHLSGEQNCSFRGNLGECSGASQLDLKGESDKRQIFRKRGLSQVLQIVQDQRKLKDINEKQQQEQQQQPSVSESACLKTEKKRSIPDGMRENTTIVKQKQVITNRRQNVLGFQDKDKLKQDSNQKGTNNLISQYHLSNKENEFNQIHDLKQQNTENKAICLTTQPQNNLKEPKIFKTKDQIKKLTLLEDIQFNQITTPSTPTSAMSRRPSRIDSSLLREQRLSLLQDFKKSDFHFINLTTTRSVSSTPSSRLFKRQYSNNHSTNTSQINQQPADNLYNVSPPHILGWNPGIIEQQQKHQQFSETPFNNPNQQILTTNPSSSIIVGNSGSFKLTPRNDHKLHLFISSQKKLLTNVNTNKSIGQLSCKARKQTVTEFSNQQQQQQEQPMDLDS